jgi:hypothetical protein
MKQAEIIYTDTTLDDLFTREGEVLEKIEDYCNETFKYVSTSYYISEESPKYKLIITIIQE